MTSQRVLVVDDDEDNVVIASTILRNNGFEVRTAYNGPTALKMLEEEEPFDLVLLDVMMPEMDGIEVLDRIKTNPRFSSLPVILVTAKTQDEDVLTGYKCGADYYITKPFTPRQLLHGIGLVLGIEKIA
jgi:CheY-like chemotaxis protein